MVETCSGKPIACDDTSLRFQLGFDLQEMKQNGFDVSVLEEHQKFNHLLDQFISHPKVGAYLRELTPSENYIASSVRILHLQQIKMEILQGAAPGGYIFPFGYLVFATSIGGNALCFHAQSEKVVWADHDSFTDGSINYKDRQTRDWNYLDFNEENIGKAVLPLSSDLERFLSDLMQNKLTEQLDKLD